MRGAGLPSGLPLFLLGDHMAQSNAAEAAAASAAPAVQIIGVNKWHGEFHVLRDINLTDDQVEKIVICGPSGSGNSMLIPCFNRLEELMTAKLFIYGI